MEPFGFLISLFTFLPWYISLIPIIFIATLWTLNLLHFFTWIRLTEKPLNKTQLVMLSIFVMVISISTAVPIWVRSNRNEEVSRKRIMELESALSRVSKGETTEEPAADTSKTLECNEWNYCTDFRTDFGLDNRYYRHTSEDPQKLILEGGPFANPPLYFEKEVSPFYKFQLDVQPLNEDAGNIFVESREEFQLFIGDNDYRSLAFLHWDREQNKWVRGEDAKIYLERDLRVSDIEPKTQFSIVVETKKKGNEAIIEFTITYKSIKGGKEIARFSRTVDLPAAEPEKFLTKVGTGMYRVRVTFRRESFSLWV